MLPFVEDAAELASLAIFVALPALLAKAMGAG
jgi:hypothetical protein